MGKAVNGIGIANLCEWHAHEAIRRGRLTVLLQKYRLSPYDIHAVYPERKFLPQKVKCLIEHLQQHCQLVGDSSAT